MFLSLILFELTAVHLYPKYVSFVYNGRMMYVSVP